LVLEELLEHKAFLSQQLAALIQYLALLHLLVAVVQRLTKPMVFLEDQAPVVLKHQQQRQLVGQALQIKVMLEVETQDIPQQIIHQAAAVVLAL
jgi:hypothetical protein